MIVEAWQTLTTMLSDGVASYDGCMGEDQWAALDAACIMLCAMCAPQSEALLSDNIIQLGLTVIEHALKQSKEEDAAMEGGTPSKPGSKRKSGAGMARSNSSSGGTPVLKRRASKAVAEYDETAQRRRVTCCALGACGVLACGKFLQEEQAIFARKVALTAMMCSGDRDVRVYGVILFRDVCVGYAAMRQDMIEELFVQVTSDAWQSEASLYHVPMHAANKHARLCVSSSTAALVHIIQNSAPSTVHIIQNSTPSTNDCKSAKETPSAVGDEQEREDATGATALCTYFFALVGNRAVKKTPGANKARDAELRAMLETLMEDLLGLLNVPEWPAAEALLSAACQRLEWFLAGRSVSVNVAYKAMAVDVLSRIIEALTDERVKDKHEGPALLSLTPEDEEPADDDGLLHPLDGHDVIGASLDKRFGKEMFTGTVTAFYPAEDAYSDGLYEVTYIDNDVEDMEWRLLLQYLRKGKGSTAAVAQKPNKSIRSEVTVRLQVCMYICKEKNSISTREYRKTTILLPHGVYTNVHQNFNLTDFSRCLVEKKEPYMHAHLGNKDLTSHMHATAYSIGTKNDATWVFSLSLFVTLVPCINPENELGVPTTQLDRPLKGSQHIALLDSCRIQRAHVPNF
jgi:hypothetical protein